MPHTKSFLKIALFAMFIIISCGKQTAPNIIMETKQILSIPTMDSNTNRMRVESNVTPLTIEDNQTAVSINPTVNEKKSNTQQVQELTTNSVESDESTEIESIPNPMMNSDNIDEENFSEETTEIEFSTSPNAVFEYGWEEYMVKPGDYLIKIAKNEYGDWKRWRDIYDWNRKEIGDNPNLIYPYHFLDMKKPMDQVEKSEPVFNEYIIQKGDNLWTIAGQTYGDEKSWIVIYWDNEEIIDAEGGILSPGMILQLRTKLDPRS